MTDASTPPLTPVKQALLKIAALRQALNDARDAINEPIAVVGIGCRLPGGSDSAEQLWDMLAAGTDAVTEVPPERWTDALYDPRPGRPGTSYCRHGAFIDGVDRFDAAFFGVSGREARRIDPQQRLLLECSWRAIEDARFTRESVKAHRTGVFVGSSLDDYARISELATDAETSPAQTALGTARPFAAGRISYLFGFHGPTVQLDTACSSSLTTTHLACQSLRQRECDLALAGGVNLMLSPEMTIGLCELQALSPDGRCKTFDAGANGYVRGEGCGMVALMRLSDARAQRRPIRAVIRGSAVNHDGKSNGMTAPNGRAQRELIRDALSRAGVAPSEVDYVEAHGTGTLLGDPIELRALHEAYCKDTGRLQPLYVGSIKTNIGHLEAAASVSSLIKVVCALQKGEIPKQLHFTTPTPHADWQNNGIEVVDRHMAWPSSRPGKRVAGISSFGMSGTNVHLVVESHDEDEAAGAAPQPAPLDAADPHPPSPQLFALSAHTPGALRRALGDCAELVGRRPELPLPALAHSLRVARDTQRHRAALVACTREQLLHGLAEARQALEANDGAPPREHGGGRLAFLFTGQGSQYGGMARRLYQSFAVFRAVVDECDSHVAACSDHALADVLWGDHQALVHDTRYTQPALFAVEIALARLWMHWGVVPDVLMGHSVGEYAAACLAGVFSLEDGIRLVAARGRLMASLTPVGKMSAVLASAADIAPRLSAYRGRVELAGDNGPRSVVLSGEPAALDALLRQLEREGFQSRPLSVSRAFHSPLMDPMLAAFREVAETVRYQAPSMRLVSNLSGRVESARLCEPAYWVEHVRRTVNFRAGMATLLADGADTCVEIGPGQALSGLARACAAEHGNGSAVRCLPSMAAEHDEREPLLKAVAAVYASGRHVDWAAFDASHAQRPPTGLVALPPCPLEPASYWVGTRRAADRARPLAAAAATGGWAAHGLLGRELHLPASTERRFEQRLALADAPFLAGHAVHGRVVFPAAALVEMALDAASRSVPGGGAPDTLLSVRDLAFDRPLVIADGRPVALAAVLAGDLAAGARLDLYSSDGEASPADGGWVRHGGARLLPAGGALDAPALHDFQADCSEPLAPDAVYEQLRAAGLSYDGAFRSVRALARTTDRAVGRIDLGPTRLPDAGRVIHPALLDNCFQVVAAALWDAAGGAVHLPVGIRGLRCRPMPQARALWCAVQLTGRAPLVSADLWLFDDGGRCVAQIDALQLAAVDARQLAVAPTTSPTVPGVYGLRWKAVPPPARSEAAPADYLVIGGGGAIDAALEAQLRHDELPCWAVPGRAPWLAWPAAGQPPEGDEDGSARFLEVLREFVQRPTSATRQVLVYVWPSAPPGDEATSAAQELANVAHAHRRFANFWRALQALDWSGRAVAVCVLTRSAQSVDGPPQPVVPAQAAAWGLARSLMHESGETRVLALDVDAADDQAAAGVLQAIGLALQSDESQFVVRAGALHVARLERRQAAAAPQALAHGAYLVSGGRGAIGSRLVEWLIGKRVPKVVSVSRRMPPDEACRRLADLAGAAGVSLEFVAADIADAASVTDLVDRLQADAAVPLKGVFHAAGTLDDGLLLTQPPASAQKVLSPKVAGTLNLHRATAGLALDHFVCFSSVVSCIGSPGQCAYGAANAYVDALSRLRNAQGLPAHVVNWGLWRGEGMAGQLDAPQRRRIAALGLQAIDAEAALQTLDGLMAEPQGQSVVWQVDVETLLQRSASRAIRPLLQGLVGGAAPADRPAAARRGSGVGQRLRGLPRGERDAVLCAHLVDELAATLQVAPGRVSPRAPLIELGLDSLMAAEFRSAIRQELDVDIPFGRLLEGATLHDIVRSIVDQMERPGSAPAGGTLPPRREAQRLDAVSSEALFGVELESGQL